MAILRRWERLALAIILATSVLNVSVLHLRREMDGARASARVVQLKNQGDLAESIQLRNQLERGEFTESIQVNASWICLTLSIVGLAGTRNPTGSEARR